MLGRLHLASLVLTAALAGVGTSTSLAPSAAAAPVPRGSTRAAAEGVAIQFRDRDVREVLNAISAATGQTFIVGDDLRGTLTITVPRRVSREEALEVLDVALYMKGFVAIETETGARKLVPVAESTASSPFRELRETDREQGRGESAVTTMIQLESASAQSVVTALKDMVGANAAVFAYEPTNSIVLAGTESQLRRLILLARALDEASDIDLAVRALRHRGAEETAELLDEVFNEQVLPSERVEVLSDARSNRLVLRGTAERLHEVRAFLDAYDVPDSGGGDLHVVRILNRDPEKLVEIIEAMGKSSRSPAPLAARGPASVGPEPPPDVGGDLTGRDFDIVVDRPTRSLVVRSDPATFDIILDVVSELDRLPPRVSVEALVVEISHPSSLTLGIDALLPLTDPSKVTDPVAVVLSNPSGGGLQAQRDPSSMLFARYTRAPILVNVNGPDGTPFVIEVPRENVSFAADDSQIRTNVRINPQLIVTSGEEHEIFSGNNIPIPVAQGAGQPQPSEEGGEAVAAATSPFVGLFLSTQQQIQRQDVGVRMRLEPTVGEAGEVELALDLEVSDIAPSIAGSVEQVGPTIEKRTIQARMRLREGQYAIVGTSALRSQAEVHRGTPFFMHIPWIGMFFSRIEKIWVDTEIVVLVQARILRDPSDDVAETIRRRLAFERSISRVNDLTSMSDQPYAVLLEVLRSEDAAHRIAESFASDGFETRVSGWDSNEGRMWDVYVTGLASLSEAGALAMRFQDAGWPSEVAILPTVNELEE